MKVLLNLVDGLWNLTFLRGYRTQVARFLIAGIAAYQWASTAPALIGAGLDLPDLSASLSGPILVYLAAKVAQFATEHQPPSAPTG